MSIYYQDDLVTLYHGDCREITAWLEADVLVTDPPYGTQLASTKNSNPGGYGRGTRAERRAGEKMIANDLTTTARDDALDAWGGRGAALVFGSPRMPDPPGEWADRHESIFVTAGFVRTDNAAVSIIEAWPEDQADHIHSKPLALMTRLVAAAPLGVIADPFAGSGSTLVAAKQLGRRAIGVELEERYCELAASRLAQDTLFGEAS